jgi:hypothetical protein
VFENLPLSNFDYSSFLSTDLAVPIYSQSVLDLGPGQSLDATFPSPILPNTYELAAASSMTVTDTDSGASLTYTGPMGFAVSAAAVPEPSSLVLVATALCGVALGAGLIRRRTI